MKKPNHILSLAHGFVLLNTGIRLWYEVWPKVGFMLSKWFGWGCCAWGLGGGRGVWGRCGHGVVTCGHGWGWCWSVWKQMWEQAGMGWNGVEACWEEVLTVLDCVWMRWGQCVSFFKLDANGFFHKLFVWASIQEVVFHENPIYSEKYVHIILMLVSVCIEFRVNLYWLASRHRIYMDSCSFVHRI